MIMIIQKMKKGSDKIWHDFLPKLCEKLELSPEVHVNQDKTWKCLLEMILKWEQNQKQKHLEYEASKTEFARILYSAAAAVESFEKEETDLIVDIVRALDMTGRLTDSCMH